MGLGEVMMVEDGPDIAEFEREAWEGHGSEAVIATSAMWGGASPGATTATESPTPRRNSGEPFYRRLQGL